MGGSKFLHDGTRGSIPVGGQRGHNHSWEFLFMSKIFLVTVPGMVIFSCAFPCFRRKKNDQTSILGERNTNSSSSTYGLAHANSPASYRPKSPYPPTLNPQFSPKLEELGLVHLSYNQVAKATQNFSPSLCIGEGGIGKLYKGQLPDGQKVAIKRAKKNCLDMEIVQISDMFSGVTVVVNEHGKTATPCAIATPRLHLEGTLTVQEDDV